MEQAHAEFFAEASGAVGLMADKVVRLAEMFRRHDIQPANEGLGILASELRDLVTTIATVQGPLGVDPARLVVEGMSPDEQIARLGSWLEALVEAQRNQDWLTIADILEYDLEPVVRGWRDVLQRCGKG